MAGVYSTPFIQEHALSSSVTYTVPDGYVAIVRDVDVYIDGEIIATTYYLVDDATDGTFAWTESPSEGNPGLYSWRGRQVFEPGTSFTFNSGGTCDVRISGYLLSQ